MSKNIVIVAGPCAIESEQQIWEMAYKISLIRDIAAPYNIDFKFRGGAYKPRTKCIINNNGQLERVFEGVGENGLIWLAQAAKKYSLPVVSELMDSADLKYFYKYLNIESDTIQIGARTSQAYGLLTYTGLSPFNVLVKNSQHGIDPQEAQGSLERITNPTEDHNIIENFKRIVGEYSSINGNKPNKEIVYCIRGQKKFIHPDGEDSSAHKAYMEELLKDQNQHPDARNLNNIRTIHKLRKNPYFQEHEILICYDPSHTWGGKTHLMRRKIGESAIEAIIKHGYNWIIIETDDKSRKAKCDAEQAMLTTKNRVDWPQTYVKEEPPEEVMPLTLVDVTKNLMEHQLEEGLVIIPPNQKENDIKRLEDIMWDLTP